MSLTETIANETAADIGPNGGSPEVAPASKIAGVQPEPVSGLRLSSLAFMNRSM